MQFHCRLIIATFALLASLPTTVFAGDTGEPRISLEFSLPAANAAANEIESLPSRSAAELLRDEATVYESQNGVGVRKLSLERYLAMQEGSEVGICYPQQAMTAEQEEAFVRHLDSQLGRPYLVRHHLTGNRAAGIHCAEYMTDAFAAAGLLHAERPPKVSPASLRQGVLVSQLHREGRRIFVSDLDPERVEGRNWCEDMWLDTVRCTSDTWDSFRRCVLCR